MAAPEKTIKDEGNSPGKAVRAVHIVSQPGYSEHLCGQQVSRPDLIKLGDPRWGLHLAYATGRRRGEEPNQQARVSVAPSQSLVLSSG